MELSIKDRSITNTLMWASILTASFDIIFTVDIGGLTLRISQLFALAVFVFFAFDVLRGATLRFPLSFGTLAVVIAFNTLWICRAANVKNAVAYDIWLIFDALEILLFTHYLSRQETPTSLVRKYILCFDALALVGWLQFILQYFGINFFVTQFHAMHRTNGFSYEPSYYATYLLMGCVICLYLLETHNERAVSRRTLLISTVLNIGALLTSTSRMGWLMLAAYAALRSITAFYLQIKAKQTNLMRLLLLLVPLGLAVLAVIVIIGIQLKVPFIMMYTQGLGLGGSAAHSSDTRITSMLMTWEVFRSSPLMGCSFGGLDAAIAVHNGWNVYEFGNGDLSMCVSVEALAALGVCGAIFYFKYIWDLSIGCYLRVRRLSAVEREDRQLLYALLLAHVFIFAILQFNQNILRTVYWTHLMLICTLWSILSAQNRETKKAGQAKEQD